MAYSHDSGEHRGWVKSLACRLRSDGVEVCLDDWDVALAGNLALYMERLATTSRESMSGIKLASLALIVAGVVGLNIAGAH